AVHIQALRNNSDFSILAASYNQGQYASYKVDFLGEAATEQQVFTYASGAHSHSSSFDKGRNLVFVANKDEHRIVIYSRDIDGQLTHVGATLVGDPRMVVYDEIFDKVYLTTEANTGHSSVVIYNIQENAGVYSLIEAQAFEMGLRGSDLKIDHKHGYVAATVREAGKEGIWALPVTSAGLFDMARMNKFIPVASKEARSLAITTDGQYYVVTCNSGQNTSDLLIYKISYDSSTNISASDLIQEIDLGAGGFQSHYVLSVE
ncbi:MAG: beta-propeller fold lactonase family protein, partial [Bdellovibrionota bacterium]